MLPFQPSNLTARTRKNPRTIGNNVRPGIIESDSVFDEAADQLPDTIKIGTTIIVDQNQFFDLLMSRKVRTMNTGAAKTSRLTQTNTKDICVWFPKLNSRNNVKGTPNIVV
jgi:hypothetical protein